MALSPSRRAGLCSVGMQFRSPPPLPILLLENKRVCAARFSVYPACTSPLTGSLVQTALDQPRLAILASKRPWLHSPAP